MDENSERIRFLKSKQTENSNEDPIKNDEGRIWAFVAIAGRLVVKSQPAMRALESRVADGGVQR